MKIHLSYFITRDWVPMATPIETLGDGRPLMLYQINQSISKVPN